MRFSIITPSYNQARYLQRSLSSVDTQKFRDFEHIIHDGLSTDGSQERLRSYAHGKSNVRLRIERDGGQVQAINNGLIGASGEILSWLNTDDFLFDADVLERVSEVFQDPSVDVVYGRGWYVDQEGEKISNVFVKPLIQGAGDLLSSLGVFQPALFFRRSVFEKLGGLDSKYQLTLDYEYWIRMLQQGVKFQYLDADLAKATLHEDSKTVGARGKQLAETLLLVKDKYGYVHPDWIERFTEHLIHQADWTSAAGRAVQSSRSSSRKLPPKHELCFMSEGLPSRLARNSRLANIMGDRSNCRRIVVTSFDSGYFVQGLNLIASLHVHARNSIDAIVIYDLGLTAAQRGLLADLEGVRLHDYPENEPWPGYFSPKSYMYKCHAIDDARRHVTPDGGEVLWIDAGVCVTGSLESVYELTGGHGVFILNHDDRPGKAMVNGAFTHPLQVESLGLGHRELNEEHVCSCVVGYKAGSHGDDLVSRAATLSRRIDINHISKHPEPKWLQAPLFEGMWKLRDRIMDPELDADGGVACLADFPFYGHRQDQSLFSSLAAMAGLPVNSATSFCPATDYSSRISFENWKSGAETTEIKRSHSLPEGHLAPLFHHRGTFSNLSGLRDDRSSFVSEDLAFVLGNGPSLKNLPFTKLRNVATIGMNAAYRYWDEHGWYPSYYCCMDTVVILSHAEAIHRLVMNASTLGIRRFFLRKIITEAHPDLMDHPRVVFLEDLRPLCPLFQVEPVTTGSYSLLFMAYLGFRRIYLAGVDCNYVERVAGSKDGDSKNKLVVTEPLQTNPNYFFDSYQRPGDEYNIPNPSKDLHVRSWQGCASAMEAQQPRMGRVRVINLNQTSKVDCFENTSPRTALLDIGNCALRLGKAFAREFGPAEESRTGLIRTLQVMFSASLGGNAGAGHLDMVALNHTRLPCFVSNGLRCVEISLGDPVTIQANELATGVMEFNAKPGTSCSIGIKGEPALDHAEKVEIRTSNGDLPLQQSVSNHIYVFDMGEGRHLLIFNIVASIETVFQGLTLDFPDNVEPSSPPVEGFRLLSIQVYSPVAGEEAACCDNPASKDSDYSVALMLFRERRYAESLKISDRLSKMNPHFRWYAELAKLCEREILMANLNPK